MAYVYRHIRLDNNEPFYIGIGKNETRAFEKKSRNKYWYNIAKNGYEVDILFSDLSWEDACKKEQEFIELYGRKDLKSGTLVNLTNGGEGQSNRFITPEVRIKLGNKRGKKESYQSSINKKKAAIKLKNEGRLSLKFGLRTKKVICTLTNKIWNSAIECAKENNIKAGYLHKLLNGTIKTNKTTFRYYGN